MRIESAMIPLLVGGLGLGLYATQIEPYRHVLRRVQVSVPPHWPRLSLLHLSDPHVKNGRDRLYRSQERFLRALPDVPDLVCVTGDVCERLVDVPRLVALLGVLSPRTETIVVLGNHEHGMRAPHGWPDQPDSIWEWLAKLANLLIGSPLNSSGVQEGHAIADALTASGVRVLMNQGVRLHLGHGSLWVAGIDSTWSDCARVAPAMQGRRAGEACLGLVHEPEGAIELVEQGATLALAGHTHGGQVKFPLLGAPVTLRTDDRILVACGLQRLGDGMLHISAGLGHSTTLRFNCPPEATWIDCIPDAGGHAANASPATLALAAR